MTIAAEKVERDTSSKDRGFRAGWLGLTMPHEPRAKERRYVEKGYRYGVGCRARYEAMRAEKERAWLRGGTRAGVA